MATAERISKLIRLLKYQWNPSPEGQLWLAVFDRALRDAWLASESSGVAEITDARLYLGRTIIPAVEFGGLETKYVLRLLKQAGLSCERVLQ